MNYRLLVPDEDKYDSGDEKHFHDGWKSIKTGWVGQKVNAEDGIIRRPFNEITTPAPIAFKDRLPTKEDGNESNHILVWNNVEKRWSWASDFLNSPTDDRRFTHWMHQPPAPPQPVPDWEKAFVAWFANHATQTQAEINSHLTDAKAIWREAWKAKGG